MTDVHSQGFPPAHTVSRQRVGGRGGEGTQCCLWVRGRCVRPWPARPSEPRGGATAQPGAPKTRVGSAPAPLRQRSLRGGPGGSPPHAGPWHHLGLETFPHSVLATLPAVDPGSEPLPGVEMGAPEFTGFDSGGTYNRFGGRERRRGSEGLPGSPAKTR